MSGLWECYEPEDECSCCGGTGIVPAGPFGSDGCEPCPECVLEDEVEMELEP